MLGPVRPAARASSTAQRSDFSIHRSPTMNYSTAVLIVGCIAAIAAGLVLGTTAAACYCG